jgi:hypothetical protein
MVLGMFKFLSWLAAAEAVDRRNMALEEVLVVLFIILRMRLLHKHIRLQLEMVVLVVRTRILAVPIQ